jgi:hypothetical protein
MGSSIGKSGLRVVAYGLEHPLEGRVDVKVNPDVPHGANLSPCRYRHIQIFSSRHPEVDRRKSMWKYPSSRLCPPSVNRSPC